MLAAGCWLLSEGLKMTVTMLRIESVGSKMLAGWMNSRKEKYGMKL